MPLFFLVVVLNVYVSWCCLFEVLVSMRNRLRAAGLHLFISAVISLGVAGLIVGIWYPHDYLWLAGGLDLLLIIVSVDVVVGPFLTLLVFDKRKTRNHLALDVAVIAIVQLCALVYGVHTTYLARPVVLAFEGDRFRLISAVEVMAEELNDAQDEFRRLSLGKIKVIAVRKSTPSEVADSVNLALRGFDTSQRPSYWVPYEVEQRQAAVDASLPFAHLMEHYKAGVDELMSAVRSVGIDPDSARYLPVRARSDFSAVAVINQDGFPVLFLSIDPYAVNK